MRRTWLAAAVLATSSVGLGPTPAHAAPMTGVVFVEPFRVFDDALPPGATTVQLPAPPGTTQALVHMTLVAGTLNTNALLLAHPCARKGDPATEGVLPIDATATVPAQNDVYVDVVDGVFCLTTPVAVDRLILDVEAWVRPAGAAYVDIPLGLTTSVAGPVTGAQLDLASAQLPNTATGVTLYLDIVSSVAGFAALYPCGSPQPATRRAAWAADENPSVLVAGVPISPTGLCITINGTATVDVSVDGYYASGVAPTPTSPTQERYGITRAPGFVGVKPIRLFDTRTSAVPVRKGQTYHLKLAQFVPVDTTAVTMNVTATETSGSGYITVYPCDQADPPPTPSTTSSLNFVLGQTVPNLVTVDAGSTLEVCFYASETTSLFADLAGYYVFDGGAGFTPSSPVRLFDTRQTTKLAAGSTFEFDLSPYVSADATSVVFNLTATDTDGPGYVTAYPCTATPPLASNLNVSAGQTVPNLVTVALSSAQHVCFYTQSPTNLLADLAGWYSPAGTSGFFAIPPVRWIDTRQMLPAPLPAKTITPIDFATDFPDATAMVFNATAADSTGAGYLTAFPCAPNAPEASNVNFVTGQAVPNMAISALSSTGEVCVYNSAPTHWIVDVSGYFTAASSFILYFPEGTDEL